MGESNSATGSIRTHAQNRRRGRRHPLDIPATLTASFTGAAQLPVKIVELSSNGIGIKTTAALKAGDIYHVHAFDTLVPLGMKVKIISARARPEGGFAIGGEVV